jgi:UDPglucose 6-dehydrogenase
VLVTEWPEFGELDLRAVAESMRGKLLIDGRNFLDPDAASAAGLIYEGVGRPNLAGRPAVAEAAV